MTRDVEQEARHKGLVLEAFDALFNRRDFEAAERYWSPGYVQHSAGTGLGGMVFSLWFTPFIVGTRVGWPLLSATVKLLV